nr:cytosine permease [Hominibacterium faecale]
MIVAICLALGADWIYDHFYIMLGVTCVFYVPMTAIAVVDYFLLRKQKLEMRSLFNMTETSKYYFWGGINWVALIIFIAAALFYLVFFNPATLVVHKPFVYFTASVGTFVPTAVIYWFCAKSFLVKKGVGGYPSL